MAELDDLIAQLRSVSEDLADRAISVLSEASRAGETRRPEAERALTQARRAVEKAIAILERQSQQSGNE
jgi:N-acetylmuramic acid 6-phosphate (MurNAc-6-P) etherase